MVIPSGVVVGEHERYNLMYLDPSTWLQFSRITQLVITMRGHGVFPPTEKLFPIAVLVCAVFAIKRGYESNLHLRRCSSTSGSHPQGLPLEIRHSAESNAVELVRDLCL